MTWTCPKCLFQIGKFHGWRGLNMVLKCPRCKLIFMDDYSLEDDLIQAGEQAVKAWKERETRYAEKEPKIADGPGELVADKGLIGLPRPGLA